MLWVILLASAVAIVVFIERALQCHRAQINSAGNSSTGVRTVLKRDNVVEALSICDDATPPALSRGWSSDRHPSTAISGQRTACGRIAGGSRPRGSPALSRKN